MKDKNYTQPEWSKQLCWLMKHNLINSIDVLEYASIIEGKKLKHFKVDTMRHIAQLYHARGGY